MLESEVIDLARRAAIDAGHEWREPIHVQRERRFLIFGPTTWCVTTNAEVRGGNLRVRISDETGDVEQLVLAPR